MPAQNRLKLKILSKAFGTYILKILETIETLSMNFVVRGTSELFSFLRDTLKLILDFSYKLYMNFMSRSLISFVFQRLVEDFRYKFVTLWSGTFLFIIIRMNSSLIFLFFVHIHNYGDDGGDGSGSIGSSNVGIGGGGVGVVGGGGGSGGG
ncbi:hypothetical protein RclHR1_03330010 [Rhizophagus clarus]|uniref:Uncharacterized protein n=1 Tax=Rhizophagus clarus TaxID=94130 RepID=A0A2Z6R9K6_9GLOM|nr:hypothetical protein RclHR1_03330010 [Rhizophagus clarus]